jgi:hypothetical protein
MGLSEAEMRIHNQIMGIKPKRAPAKGNFVAPLKDFIQTIGYPEMKDVKIEADRYQAKPVRYAYTIVVMNQDFAGYNRDFSAWSQAVSQFYEDNRRKSMDGLLIFRTIVNPGGERRPRKINLHRKKPLTEAEIEKTWAAGREAKQRASEEEAKKEAKKAKIRKPGVVKVAEVRASAGGRLSSNITIEQKKYGVMVSSPVGREAVISYAPDQVVDFMERPLDYVSSRYDRSARKPPEGVRFSVLDAAVADALMWVKYLINRGD